LVWYSSNVDSCPCSKIAEVLSVEASTDISPEEDSTVEPDASTILPTTNDEEISSVDEKSHNVLNDDDNKEIDPVESQSQRRKRQAVDDERNDNQLLDKIPQQDSSQLPVEHRGLDDEEVNDSHENNNSSSTKFAPWFSVTSALFLLIGLTGIQLNHI
jgi:hypothetical protein